MRDRAAARRYARALFETVPADADLERVEGELAAFVDLLGRHEALARALLHPTVPAARKRAAVAALLDRDGSISPAVGRLLLLLAERDRLRLLPQILEAYRERLLAHRRIVRAEVVTAMALPEDRRQALEAGLAAATGLRVAMDVRVDPSIVGGVVARIGSTIYDGSVVRQLERLRERLAARGEP
ncbi:MAG TPA: ATP synthase F1 subunit delta [Vicinamibacterales bacterium]|nr:ATP synthase F1 subunit delta [Vicinamibacterales bacterium]